MPKKQGVKLNNESRFVLDKAKFHELLKVLTLTPEIHDLVLFGAKTGLRFGLSWFHRWRRALGLPNRLRDEPDPPRWVLERYDALP